MSSTTKLLDALAKELEESKDTGIDRALRAMENMHKTTLEQVGAVAIEAMARLEREAQQNRQWAREVLVVMTNIRLSTENPTAAKLAATIAAATAAGAPGASPANKSFTDAGVPRRGGNDDDEGDEVQPVDDVKMRERVIGQTGDTFAGVSIPPTR
jgi:hypothetical protein